MPNKNHLFLFSVLFLFLIMFVWSCIDNHDKEITGFQSARAFSDLEAQVAMGPRIPASDGYDKFNEWLNASLQSSNWEIENNTDTTANPPIQNIIAHKNSASNHWILLGAHYDTRANADQAVSVDDQNFPVPGANDGASGVAILTELARSLPDTLSCHISLAFFDAEDQGQIGIHEWSEGTTFYSQGLTTLPDAVVIIDMVGDKNLEIYQERNSTPTLTDDIWSQAALLGYENIFFPKTKYSMIDDHLPFLALNIDTTLIIDFDYPVWHTPQDDISQVSVESLAVVGDTVYAWLVNHPLCQND